MWYCNGERDKDTDEEEYWSDGDNPDEMKLKHMIVLADDYESGGRSIVLDISKGNIHEDRLECNLLSEVPIESFFDGLESNLETLEFVPVPGRGRHEGAFYDVLDIEGFDEPSDVHDEDAARRYKSV